VGVDQAALTGTMNGVSVPTIQIVRREVVMLRRFVTVVLIIGSAFAGTALAHHSVTANFDQTKTLDITGKVKKIDIRNPHSEITLEVPKPGGGVSVFHVEWSDKNALLRRTVPVSKMRVGDTVTINVNPSKRLPDLGYFRTATLPDGTVLKDCGFAAYRDSVAKGTKITC
jgi:hypothetical protein